MLPPARYYAHSLFDNSTKKRVRNDTSEQQPSASGDNREAYTVKVRAHGDRKRDAEQVQNASRILRASWASPLSTLAEGPSITCPLMSPSENYACSQSEIRPRKCARIRQGIVRCRNCARAHSACRGRMGYPRSGNPSLLRTRTRLRTTAKCSVHALNETANAAVLHDVCRFAAVNDDQQAW